MVRIAVDGMGGDYAPQMVVEGAALASTTLDHEIILVGREEQIKSELRKHKVVGGRISVRHAPDVVEMHESPVAAIKRKKDSSINVCIDLLKQGQADAVVTAGNTGAAVAAATLNLGLLAGIKRPGIAITVPTLQGISLAIDVGANIDPAPEHLYQYAVMADVYARAILNKRRPTVGLLNIGEEESKGTDLMREAYKLLRDSELNFIGNIEGRDFLSGKCDCIVCDGFVGNVMLKFCESIVETITKLLRKKIVLNPVFKVGAALCKPALEQIRCETSYEEAGGAPLLGVNGTVLISHGGSSARAIANAVAAAVSSIERGVNAKIVKEISGTQQHELKKT